MDPDKPKVSLLSLPRELLDHIIGFVDIGDKAARAWREEYEQNSHVQLRAEDSPTGLYGLGIKALSMTSSVFCLATKPYLVTTLTGVSNVQHLHLAKHLPGVARNTPPVAPFVRSVTLSTSRRHDDAYFTYGGEGKELGDQFEALTRLPRVNSIHISQADGDDLDNVFRDLGRPQYSFFGREGHKMREPYKGMSHLEMLRAGALPAFPDIANRISSWTFTNFPTQLFLPFISLSPSSITSLSIDFEWSGAYYRPWHHQPDGLRSEPSHSVYDFLSGDHEGLRNVLASCTSLKSFSATSVVADPADAAVPAIHPSWLVDGAFPTTLTSLDLTLNRFDDSVLAFLARFPALRHLSLYVPRFTTALPTIKRVRLPSLVTLSLHQASLEAIVHTTSILSTPKLERWTIISPDSEVMYDDPATDADSSDEDNERESDIDRLVDFAHRCRRSLKEIHLKSSGDSGVWSPYHFEQFTDNIAINILDARVIPHWPLLRTRALDMRKTALSVMEELVDFARDRVEEFKRTGEREWRSSTEMNEVLSAMSELYKLKEAKERWH
ncbi:hypothetical protein JCM8097_002061 [Rhodosporidiobolus ruineniae]